MIDHLAEANHAAQCFRDCRTVARECADQPQARAAKAEAVKWRAEADRHIAAYRASQPFWVQHFRFTMRAGYRLLALVLLQQHRAGYNDNTARDAGLLGFAP